MKIYFDPLVFPLLQGERLEGNLLIFSPVTHLQHDFHGEQAGEKTKAQINRNLIVLKIFPVR